MPATPSPSRPFRLSALVLAIVLLALVGVATIGGIRSFSQSIESVERSHRVIAKIEATESAVRSAESNARAYRLTERAEQQAEYLVAVPLARQWAAALVVLSSDNPAQEERALRLQQLVYARLDEINRLVDLQNQQGAERARLASLRAGIDLMQEITLIAEHMRITEQNLLDQRHEASSRRANRLTGFVVLGIVLPMVLMGLLLTSLVRETRRSRELEHEARQAMRQLEDSVLKGDRLSERRRSLGVYAGLLQSCQSLEEAMSLTASVLHDLLPDAGGRCYTLHASQNLAESSAVFGAEAVVSAEMMAPDQCWALRRGQPHRTDDQHGHVRCGHLDRSIDLKGIWTLCVPLIAQGTSLGLLHVNSTGGDGQADSDTVMIEAIAEQLSLAMINLQLRETLRIQSLRDSLTGLYNRRYLEDNLHRELQRCERRGLPLSVLMLDVDHFKRFNDEHGHAAGDALLARIGQTLQEMTRDEDIACRYGGEEFTIVLPEANAENAQRRADHIRAKIGTITITHMRRQLGPVTASIGTSTFPEHGSTPERLLHVADAALYRAKAEGRDRVVGG